MRLVRWIALPSLLLFLAACQDSQERAEEFYRSGVELRDAGDLPRAAVEFRNVFRYDGEHKAARTDLAEVLLEQGNPGEAFSQYLRLAEQYPDDVDVRIALSEIAVSQQAWDALQRHGAVAVELAPDRPESRASAALIDYIAATDEDDPAARAEAVERAEILIGEDADNMIALRLVIIGRLSDGDLEPALVAIDAALALTPDDLALNTLKLQTLNALERPDDVETLLVDLYARFPDNEQISNDLIAWYMQREDLDAVETLIRDRAGPVDGPTDGHIALIQFLNQTKGAAAARAETAALIDANSTDATRVDTYIRADAALAFESGSRDEAIASVRARLADEFETAETAELQTMLAQMLIATGDQVGARALVEQVLAAEAGNVTALKLQANWLIDADKTTEAIAALRLALDQAPNDPTILSLMARAHERDGSMELAGERLALAVEMSGDAPAEAMSYARFLVGQGRGRVAATVISEALDANPGNIDLLTEQARLALADDDADTAAAAISALERIEGDQVAADRATALRAALLLGQQRFDEGIALLEQRAEGDASGEVVLDVVRTRLRAGQVDEAKAYLALRLAERPDDPNLRFADAVLQMAEGRSADAETGLNALIAEFPEAEAPARQLYGLLVNDGRTEEAAEALDAALVRIPDNRNLLLLRASRFESEGDLEGALTIYERLYDLNGDDPVAANNYASLLSDLRDDPESLARATAVARRLADTDIPDFKDTYGWIAYRRGAFDEARKYLEAAADGRPDNPVIFYHLGMAYIALERTEDARTALTRSIELGQGRSIPQLDEARTALEGL